MMRTLSMACLLLVCLLGTSCAVLPGSSETPLFTFSFNTKGSGNELVIRSEDKIAIIDVFSQSGIGSAKIQHVSGAFPEKMILRLHLKGLEKFSLAYNEMKITASITSSDSRTVIQSLALSEGDEHPIGPGNPLWMDIGIVSDQVTPEIPLVQGYFEITLPEGLLTDANPSFSIEWIDFYR